MRTSLGLILVLASTSFLSAAPVLSAEDAKGTLPWWLGNLRNTPTQTQAQARQNGPATRQDPALAQQNQAASRQRATGVPQNSAVTRQRATTSQQKPPATRRGTTTPPQNPPATNQGTTNQGTTNQGTTNQGTTNQGTTNQGTTTVPVQDPPATEFNATTDAPAAEVSPEDKQRAAVAQQAATAEEQRVAAHVRQLEIIMAKEEQTLAQRMAHAAKIREEGLAKNDQKLLDQAEQVERQSLDYYLKRVQQLENHKVTGGQAATPPAQTAPRSRSSAVPRTRTSR